MNILYEYSVFTKLEKNSEACKMILKTEKKKEKRKV